MFSDVLLTAKCRRVSFPFRVVESASCMGRISKLFICSFKSDEASCTAFQTALLCISPVQRQ